MERDSGQALRTVEARTDAVTGTSDPGPRPDPAAEASYVSSALAWTPVLVIAAAPVALLGRVVTPVLDPDTFWHIVGGRHLWATWQFSGDTPWPPAATQPWVMHEWLPELAFAAADHLGGLRAVAFVQGVLALTLLLAVYACARQFARPLPSTMATLLAWVGASASISARPQMVTFVLLAVSTAAWLRTATDRRPRWWLVPLTYLWACSHGLWFAGAMVGGAVLVGLVLERSCTPRELLRLAALVAASALAGLVTPAGPGLLLSIREIGKSTQYVAEWAPASLSDPYLAATALMAAVVAVVWARQRTPVPWAHVAVWGLAVAWALTYGRTVALGAVMLAPLVARAIDTPLPASARSLRVARERLVVGVGFGAATLLAAVLAAGTSAAPAGVPTALDPALERLPAGTVVFNEYSLGGWLLFDHGNVASVIDGRSDLYESAYVASYMSALTAAPGWQETVTATRARHALLPEGNALAGALQAQWGWTPLAHEEGYVLLVAPTAPA